MQEVEQQRLDQRGIGPHGIEVEDLQPLERQGVLDVVEQVGVAASLNPLLQPSHQGSRQQVGEREQPALIPVEDVEVLDSFVDFPILQLTQPISVFALEQHADESVKEVQMLGGWRHRERVNANVLLPQPKFDVATVKERSELPVPVTEIQYHREWVVLLRVRDQEVQKEALAAAGCAEHECVAHVLDVQVVGERRVVRRLEGRQWPRQQQ